VIVGDPGPVHDIAGLDGDRARDEISPALSHVHIRRRRKGQHRQQDQKRQRQCEINFPAGHVWRRV
jgi:hypothetical protein